MRELFVALALAVSFAANAQSLPAYQMKFQFRDGNGNIRDTMLSRINYIFWGKSSGYPSYVKWKGQPFALLHSAISGIGLFTDSVTSFFTGQQIGYAFYKIGSAGNFELDYLQSNIGSFVNNSGTPNVEVSLSPQGIVMKAKQYIAPNTELVASYQELINLFPGDKTAERAIKYW